MNSPPPLPALQKTVAGLAGDVRCGACSTEAVRAPEANHVAVLDRSLRMDPRQKAKATRGKLQANRGKLVLLVALLLVAITLLVRMTSPNNHEKKEVPPSSPSGESADRGVPAVGSSPTSCAALLWQARNASNSGESVDAADGGGGVDSAPLPPDRDRLFGAPLPRVQLDGESFEPDAYARYYPDDTDSLTPDQLKLHYQVCLLDV